MAAMTCPECDTDMIHLQRKPVMSAGGFLAGIVCVIGLFTLLFNALLGLMIIILSLIIGMCRSKQSFMSCPNCGEEFKVGFRPIAVDEKSRIKAPQMFSQRDI